MASKPSCLPLVLCVASCPILSGAPADQPPVMLSDPVDVSGDFHDFKNTYFLADSLSGFDPATGAGNITWQRNHLYPRIAFNTMEGMLRPFGGVTFPEVEYAVNPTLPLSIQFVSPRTVRIRVKTGVDAKPPAEELMLVGEPPRDSSWRMSKIEGGYRYTSAAGSVTVLEKPWHIEFRDAQGRLLTRTNHESRQPCHSGAGAALLLHPPAVGLFPQRGGGVLACGGREAVRLRRIVHRAGQARPEGHPVDQRRARPRELPHVQAHPVLHEQPRLRDVRAHLGALDVRFRRHFPRRQRDAAGRRRAGPVRVPRPAQGHSQRVHQPDRQGPHASAVVLRTVDEPHQLLLRGGGAAGCRQAPREPPAERRDPPRHRLVRVRLALRLQVLHLALQGPGQDDRRPQAAGSSTFRSGSSPTSCRRTGCSRRSSRKGCTSRTARAACPTKTRCWTSPTRPR